MKKLEIWMARAACAAALVLATATAAVAQTSYPAKPVTLVAAYPPGGTVDLLARVLGQKLSEEWKQPVLVENRAGASGIIGSQQVARAAPDGYTLMVVPITHVTNSSLIAKVPYNPIDDFTPITLLGSQPIMLVVNQQQRLKTVADVIAQAKANPGKLNCGSGGNGTSQHLACELFKSMAQVDIKHIPYKGNAAAMTDVIGGQIEMLFDQMATAVPHVKSRRVSALGVSTATRSPAMPDVPTIAEAGVPGFETVAWFGVVGPANMPRELVTRVNASFQKALALPEVRQQLGDQGLTLTATSPEEFGTYLKSEMAKWARVIKQAGIRVE